MAGRTERTSACSDDAELVRRAVAGSCGGERPLLPAGCKVLVACSGGADSTALAAALAAHARASPAQRLDLVIGHIDHGLRAESAAEVELVRALAARLSVRCCVARLPSLRAAVARDGLERAAREARYAALVELARGAGATHIATAHTRRDQAETLLLRLARGAGPSALAGVRARRSLSHGLLLVRPLLGVPRAATEALCAREGLPLVDDPHNVDPARLRTRVRTLLPELARQLNPRLEEALAASAALLADEDELIQSLADSALAAARSGPHALDAAAVAALHPALQRRVLLTAALQASCRPARAHLESIRAALLRAGEGPRWQLHVPRGVAQLEAGRLCFKEAKPRAKAVAEATQAPMGLAIARAGRYAWNGRLLVLSEGGDRGTLVDETRAPFPWTLRGHRAGDRFRPGGGRAKKVADLWIDARVPRRERAGLALLEDAAGIIFWVEGLRAGEPSRGQLARPFAVEWTMEMDVGSAGLCTVLR